MATALAACGSNSFSIGRSSHHHVLAAVGHDSGSTTTQPLPSTTPLTTPTSLPKPAPIVWTTCSSLAAEAVTSVGQFQCGTLRVPISYSDPGAGSLSLALVRLPASGPGPVLGDIVTNPGGPGGSGVDFLEQNANRVPGLAQIEVQSRQLRSEGSGRSDPVDCVSPTAIRQLLSLDPTPRRHHPDRQVVAATKQFDAAVRRPHVAAACSRT